MVVTASMLLREVFILLRQIIYTVSYVRNEIFLATYRREKWPMVMDHASV